jgi:hypothetical protein
MTPLKKKWFHAGVVAMIGALTDIAAQLTSGHFDAERTVVIGIIIGAVSRVSGAILAAMDSTNDEESES